MTREPIRFHFDVDGENFSSAGEASVVIKKKLRQLGSQNAERHFRGGHLSKIYRVPNRLSILPLEMRLEPGLDSSP